MKGRMVRLALFLACLASCLVGILSCNVSNSQKPDTLTFRLPDSLTVDAGKYDAVRLDLYSISGTDTVFVKTLFSGPYEEPGTTGQSAIAGRAGRKFPGAHHRHQGRQDGARPGTAFRRRSTGEAVHLLSDSRGPGQPLARIHLRLRGPQHA